MAKDDDVMFNPWSLKLTEDEGDLLQQLKSDLTEEQFTAVSMVLNSVYMRAVMQEKGHYRGT